MQNSQLDTLRMEMLEGFCWYFESKNLALRNVFPIRTQLSIEKLKELRQYYSLYFASLLAVTERLLEEEKGAGPHPYWREFKHALNGSFIVEGFPDGEKNYFYLKELRNSIVHRGLDITSASHFHGDFPLLLAPPVVTNRDGTKKYPAFAPYLLGLIEGCESVLVPIVVQHLDQYQYFSSQLTEDDLRQAALNYLMNSYAVPNSVKPMAAEMLKNVAFRMLDNGTSSTMKSEMLINAFDAAPLDLKTMLGIS